jgi:hypothetical protein
MKQEQKMMFITPSVMYITGVLAGGMRFVLPWIHPETASSAFSFHCFFWKRLRITVSFP